MRLLPVLALGSLIFSGCTYSIHNVHMSDMSPAGSSGNDGEGRLIKAQAEQFVILGFVGQTNYLNEAYKKIQDECPKGEIRGISTQHSTAHGFFSWTNKILIQGNCYGEATARNDKTDKAKPAVRGSRDDSVKGISG